jgi:hypothetical protein
MSVIRALFESLVRAGLFIGLDLYLRRFLGSGASNLCAMAGFGLCEVVRHAGIDCVVNFLAKNWREIIALLTGFVVLAAPLMGGGVLLWYQHPFLAWPLMIVGEPAMLALVIDKKRKEIIEWSFAILFFTAPLWIGGLLHWYGHPLLGEALMIIGETAVVIWIANLPDQNPRLKPPADSSGPAGTPPDAGTPSAVAPA